MLMIPSAWCSISLCVYSMMYLFPASGYIDDFQLLVIFILRFTYLFVSQSYDKREKQRRRERKKEKQRSSIWWFTAQMAATPKAGPG